jgi:hypothetical protein
VTAGIISALGCNINKAGFTISCSSTRAAIAATLPARHSTFYGGVIGIDTAIYYPPDRSGSGSLFPRTLLGA